MPIRFLQSLYGRIFASLWTITTLIVGGAIGLTWLLVADRADNTEAESRVVLTQLAQILDHGGEEELVNWLRTNQSTRNSSRLLVIRSDGRELLGRELPSSLAKVLAASDLGDSHTGTVAVLPSRPVPELVDPEGHHYAVVTRGWQRHSRVHLFPLLPIQARSFVVLLALVITATVSSLLTRSITRPVHALRQAARHLSTGALATRVTGDLVKRSDELGELARDFNAMAARLQSLVQVREQLLRDVSHELLSPLARMRVALGLVNPSDADTDLILKRLETEIARLDHLIGQVLNLARLDSSLGKAIAHPVDLTHLIDVIARDAEFEGQSRRVSVTAKYPDEPIVILGREAWIASAVENVVRNAVRYSEADSVVEVNLRASADGTVIEVADRGCGVPEADLIRIFEPFYRVAAARERESGGDGIGLAITARVMQLHGGHAVAESREGGGLLIRLWFPKADGPAALSGAASQI